MPKIGKPVCVAPAGDHCGEGIVWHGAQNALYWVDINRFLIHKVDVNSNAVLTWFFEEPVTAMILTDRDDTLAVTLGSRVILWKPETDERRDFGFNLPGWPEIRSNDARADPRGSLWIATMGNNVNPDGSPGKIGGEVGKLYRVDTDGRSSIWRENIIIANTVGWSPDRKHFYSADSGKNVIRVYEYDERTGDIGGEEVFFQDYERGVPDGSTVDSEGYLWNCRHGGGCIVRLTPNGEIDTIIEMPVSNLTTCTFGGPDLTTLYAVSAALGAKPGERFAGGLFQIETGIKGQPENRFRVFESK